MSSKQRIQKRFFPDGPWWSGFKCSICPSKDFDKDQYANQHQMSKGHKDNVEWMKCNVTKWSFVEGLQCAICSAKVSTVRQARDHEATKHQAPAERQAQLLRLNAEETVWELEGTSFACMYCEKLLGSFAHAKRHERQRNHRNKVLQARGVERPSIDSDVSQQESEAAPEAREGEELEAGDVKEPPEVTAMKEQMWNSSPMALEEDRAVPDAISKEERASLLEGYQRRFDIEENVFVCCCCGLLSHGTGVWAEPHPLLAADDNLRQRIEAMSPAAQQCFSTLSHGGKMFQISATQVRDDGAVQYCADCDAVLQKSKLPTLCIRTGYDFGFLKGLPELSFLEKVMIARVRHYNTIVKIRGFTMEEKYSGHYISFPHEGPRTALKLPRRDILQSVQVVFVGSRTHLAKYKSNYIQLLSVRPNPMLEWLRLLKEVNKFYFDVGIDEDFEMPRLGEQLVSEAHVADSVLTARLENLTVGAGGVQAANEQGMAHVLVTPKTADVEGYNALAGLMRAVRNAVPRKADVASREEEPPPEVPTVSTSPNPLVEFTNDKYLMGGGFPWLFMAFDFGVLSHETAVVGQRFVRHVISWGDGRFARDPIFAFMTMNQIQRHSLTQQVARYIRPGQKTSAEQIVTELQSPEFSKSLDAAIKDPEAPESQRLQKKLLRHIGTYSSKVPWSDFERKACLPRMLSMYQFGGMPSIFYTVSPADMDQPLILKLCIRSTRETDQVLHEETFPPDLAMRTNLQKGNPAYCCIVFDLLVRAVIEELLQCQACGREEKKTKHSRRGIFGRSFLNFAVVEAQGRGSLHVHGLLWTEFDVNLLNRTAGAEDEHLVAAALDTMCYSDSAPHPKPAAAYRGALVKSPPFGTQECEVHVSNIAHTVQRHSEHTDTCFKSGDQCRYGYPMDSCDLTGAYYLVREADNKVSPHYPCPARPVTTYTDLGYEQIEQHPIMWRTKRGKISADVVAYNEVLSAATGSNTAIVLLGATAMAVAVMFYLLKYLTKPPTGISNAASCLREALELQKTRPVSSAAPSGTASGSAEGTTPQCSASTRSFMNKFACRYLAKMEVSSQQAFSCILRNPASYESHCFAYCRVRAALDLRKRDDKDSSETEDADVESEGEPREHEGQLPEHDDGEEVESDAEDDHDDEEVAVDGCVPFTAREDRGITARRQEVDYRWRGKELETLCLYEYCALVSIVALKVDKLSTKKQGPGRPTNLVVEFDHQHPDSTTHMQQLKSKFLIPVLAGKGPPRPVGRGTYVEHCSYMCTLFIPWGGENIMISRPVKAWKAWLERNRCGTTMQRALFRVAQNVAHPLESRASTAVRDLISKFRFQNAASQKQLQKQQLVQESADPVAEALLEEVERAMGDEASPAELYVENLTEAIAIMVESEVPVVNHAPKKAIVRLPLGTNPKYHGPEPDGSHTVKPSYDFLNPFAPKVMLPSADKFKEEKHRDQKAVFNRLVSVLFSESPDQRLFLVTGGPGSGKTVVSQELARVCPMLVPCSTTAVTAKKIHPRAVTYQKALGLGGDKPNIPALQKKWNSTHQPLKGILVDEVSMLGVKGSSSIDERARLIKMNPRQPFGGLVVIYVGDFHQLPCVKDKCLYCDPVALAGFVFLEVTIDIRAEGDDVQRGIVRDMRSPVHAQQALERFLKVVPVLRPEETEFLDRSVILVATNLERCALSALLAPRYAMKVGELCLRFPLRPNPKFKGHHRNEVEGYAFFIRGATGHVIENCAKSELCNGMTVKFESLSYNDDRLLKEAQHAIRNNGSVGGVIDVPSPSFINVTVVEDEKMKRSKPKGNTSTVFSLGECKRLQPGDHFVDFMVVTAFAVTLHKAQGLTLKSGILQLSDRPPGNKAGRLTIEGVYVAISRFEDTKSMRLFPGGGSHSQLLRLMPSPKVIEWYEKARETGLCTATKSPKKPPRGFKAAKDLQRAKRARDPQPPASSRQADAEVQTVRAEHLAPAIRSQTVANHRNEKRLSSPEVQRSVKTCMSARRRLPEAPTNHGPAGFIYKGTKNPGTACHTSAFLAALCAVSTALPDLETALTTKVPNTLKATSETWEVLAREHGVPLDALVEANRELYASVEVDKAKQRARGVEEKDVKGLWGKEFIVPDREDSMLSTVRRLCTAENDSKEFDLFLLADKLQMPLPTPEAQHQCSFAVLTLLKDVIPVWRDVVKFDENTKYQCPWCNTKFDDTRPRASFEILISNSSPVSAFSIDFFSDEEDRTCTWKCPEKSCLRELRNVPRMITRTLPKVLCVVLQRREHEGGTICTKPFTMPTSVGPYELKAVIRHVLGGTHFVTKILNVCGGHFIVDDSVIRGLLVSENQSDTMDFIHLYVKKEELRDDHVSAAQPTKAMPVYVDEEAFADMVEEHEYEVAQYQPDPSSRGGPRASAAKVNLKQLSIKDFFSNKK